MPIRIIDPQQFRRMPWKNGGGETIEIAAFPEGADLTTFAWRISMARVAADGPFSRFEGIDRTLSVIEGEALDLIFDAGSVRLDPSSDPYSFAGDLPVTGLVPAGPIVDLNVMTRRTLCQHRVMRVGGGGTVTAQGEIRLVLAHRGEAQITVEGITTTLVEGHAAILASAGAATVLAAPGGTTYLVEIEPA